MKRTVNATLSFPFKAARQLVWSLHARPLRVVARQVLISAPLLTLATSLYAQQPLPLDEARSRGLVLFQQSAVTGMVLVVVRGREAMIESYGETYPGSGQKPDANSLIRLCSVTKVFAGDLLVRLAAEGKVKLNDPLQRYAPTGKVVPQAMSGEQITLLALATHTAGLPREVAAYPANTPHFTFPDFAARWAWLPRQKLIFPPGTAALYSNVGFDLLGDALASASAKSYAHLLHTTLLEPLGMWDTTLFPSNSQCARLLRPTSDQGLCTETQASGASGGLYSTDADMVKLLQYLLRIPTSPIQPAGALDLYLRPQQLKSMQGLSHAGDATGIGLGWVQIGAPDSPSAIMEKTGSGAGFTTYLALSPQRQTGIFVAVTDGHGEAQVDLFHESNNLLAALANVSPLPPKVRPTPAPKHHPKRHRAVQSPQHASSLPFTPPQPNLKHGGDPERMLPVIWQQPLRHAVARELRAQFR
ncbi:MAG: D-alanyl-D-alanine-carboxypeptidase/endopeptidase AmpH [Terracidiphilus sp.]